MALCNWEGLKMVPKREGPGLPWSRNLDLHSVGTTENDSVVNLIASEHFQDLTLILKDWNRRTSAIGELRDFFETSSQRNILRDAANSVSSTRDGFELRSFLDLYCALAEHVPEEVPNMVNKIPKEARKKIILMALSDSDDKVSSTANTIPEDTPRRLPRNRSDSEARSQPHTMATSRTSGGEDKNSRSGKGDPSAFREITEMFDHMVIIRAIQSDLSTEDKNLRKLLLYAREAIVEQRVEFLKSIMNILHKMIQGDNVEAFWETMVSSGGANSKNKFPRYRLLWETLRSGNWKVFRVVYEYLPKTMVSKSAQEYPDALLLAAIEGGIPSMIKFVMRQLRDQIKKIGKDQDKLVGALCLVSRNQRPRALGVLAHKVNHFAGTLLTDDGCKSLSWAVGGLRLNVVEKILELINKDSAKVAEVCTPLVSKIAPSLQEREPSDVNWDHALEILCHLLKNGARPKTGDLIDLWGERVHIGASDKPLDKFREKLKVLMRSVENPFIPGINLAVKLHEASKRVVSEGDKTVFKILKRDVLDFLLEILERLPNTVRDCGEKGLDTCCNLFEPSTAEFSSSGFKGPLGVALQHRPTMEELCSKPLVLDYISRKFNDNIVVDFSNVRLRTIRQDTRLSDQSRDSTKARDFKRNGGKHGEGTIGSEPDNPRYEWLPSGFVQHAATRILQNPNHDQIPMCRMMFEFQAYVGMLILFNLYVRLGDDRAPGVVEIGLFIFVLAAVLTELLEIKRDLFFYLRDPWNVLDWLSLTLLFSGLVVRITLPSSSLGRSLYALSTPLLISRLLFFAQIFQHQGPMIQVVFSMARELVRFGIVMFIIILGFAMSLHALFWGSSDDYTYGSAFLDLFMAMLGDVELLEKISETGNGQEDVATTLVVTYLIIMTIMMLNLLIAVLSTAHAKVHGNIDMEYQVSSARLMGHYVWAVKQHILPAPFNLVIFAVWCVFISLHKFCGWDKCDEACNFTTKFINLVFFCPVVFAVGSLAWLVLLPRHLWKTCTSRGDRRGDSRSLACARKVLLHFTMDGPLLLGFLWVTRLVELLCPTECVKAFCVRAGCLKSTDNNTNSCENRDGGTESADQATPPTGCVGPFCVRARCMKSTENSTTNLENGDGGAEGAEGTDQAAPPIGCVRRFCVRAGCKSTENSTIHPEKRDGGAKGTENAEAKNQNAGKTLAEMLKDSCEGMGVDEIQDYVENPFKDLSVRRGESTREATVEHMKRLGSYLENKMDAMEGKLDAVEGKLDAVEGKLDVMNSNAESLRYDVNNLLGALNINPREPEQDDSGEEEKN